MSNFVVGVDVGGTGVKLGLIDDSGVIIARSRLETGKYSKSRQKLIMAIAQKILELIKTEGISKRNILGVGVGLPGPIDCASGVVRYLPNIPGWKNVPFQAILEKETGLYVRIDNDVNVITLGEWGYGAGKGCSDLLCITLGTGVGGGLILNGKMYRGTGYAAGELGHIPMLGRPLQKDGTFLVYEKSVGHRQLSQLGAQIFGEKDPIPTQDLFKRANKGDKKALQFWEEAGMLVGLGLVGPITLLNPERVIIGGGVSNNYKYLHKPIKKVIKQHSMQTAAQNVKVVRAALGDNAGIIGAQVLIKESLLS